MLSLTFTMKQFYDCVAMKKKGEAKKVLEIELKQANLSRFWQ